MKEQRNKPQLGRSGRGNTCDYHEAALRVPDMSVSGSFSQEMESPREMIEALASRVEHSSQKARPPQLKGRPTAGHIQ